MPIFDSARSLKRLFPTNRGRRPKPTPTARLRLEALEERCTPTVQNLTHPFAVPTATIQAAIDSAQTVNGDVLLVSPGTYAENVTINKSIILEGAKHGQDAATRFAAFVGGKANPATEAVLTAPTSNPTGGNPNANDLIRVLAGGVTIDGLVIDGNNPALTHVGGVTGNGVAIDARSGVTNTDAADNPVAVSGLLIENDIIQNVAQRGVSLDNNNGSVGAANLITGNVIHNFGSDPTNGGWGVLLLHNAYADVTNNTIIDDAGNQGLTIGLQQQLFTADGSMTWSGNHVTVGQDDTGVISNDWTAANGVLNILGNTVNAATGVTGTDDLTWGVYVLSVLNGSTVNLTGNAVGSAGGQFARGFYFWDLPTSRTVTVSGGTVANSVVGVDLESVDPFFGTGNPHTAGTWTINLNNVAITGGTTGVRIQAATVSQFNPPPASVDPLDSVAANLTGVTITGATTGVLAAGFSPAVTATVTLFRDTVSGATTGVQVNANGILGTVAQPTTQNIITGDTTGIAIAAGAGTVQPIIDNNLSGDSGAAINNGRGTLVDASLNWWGSNTASGVGAKAGANVDYTPFFDSGLNTQPAATPGFQGDFSVLDVAAASPEAGAAGRIQEGVHDVLVGGTVNVTAGTYAENVTISKNLTLAGAPGNPPTAIVHPAAGDGITVAGPATNVTVNNLEVTGAANGVNASGVGTVTLQNLKLDGDATGFAASNLTTLNLSDLTLTGDTTGGTISNVPTVNYTPDSGSAGTSAAVTGNSFQRGSDQAVGYSGVSSLNVFGGGGSDTFTVTPSAATTFTVHGNAPTPQGPPLGDTLIVKVAGATSVTETTTFDPAAGFSGSWTFGNRLPVNFDGIERLQETPSLLQEPPIDFSIVQGGTLWEHNLAFDPSAPADALDMHWREISSGAFSSIATTRDPTTGSPVVFGILSGDGSLWEYNLSFDPSAPPDALDAHWRKISSGPFVAIAAAWDSTGVGGPVVFAAAQGGGLWEHDLNFDSNLSAEQIDAHWRQISSGTFTSLAAAQDFTGVAAGAPVVFGLVQGGVLWEHDLNFDPARPIDLIDAHWAQISSGFFTAISAAQDFTGPVASAPVVFGVVQGGNLWEHDLNFDPYVSSNLEDIHWRRISSAQFTAISAAQDFSALSGGAPAVFGVRQGGGLLEYDLNFDPGAPAEATDSHVQEISDGVFTALGAAADFTGASAGAPAVFGVPADDHLWENDLNFDPSVPPGQLNAHWRKIFSQQVQSTSAV